MPPIGETPKAAEAKRKLLAALYLGMNVVTAVSLIMLNKVILSKLGFHYTYCLTFFHMVATVLGEPRTPPSALLIPDASQLRATNRLSWP